MFRVILHRVNATTAALMMEYHSAAAVNFQDTPNNDFNGSMFIAPKSSSFTLDFSQNITIDYEINAADLADTSSLTQISVKHFKA